MIMNATEFEHTVTPWMLGDPRRAIADVDNATPLRVVTADPGATRPSSPGLDRAERR